MSCCEEKNLSDNDTLSSKAIEDSDQEVEEHPGLICIDEIISGMDKATVRVRKLLHDDTHIYSPTEQISPLQQRCPHHCISKHSRARSNKKFPCPACSKTSIYHMAGNCPRSWPPWSGQLPAMWQMDVCSGAMSREMKFLFKTMKTEDGRITRSRTRMLMKCSAPLSEPMSAVSKQKSASNLPSSPGNNCTPRSKDSKRFDENDVQIKIEFNPCDSANIAAQLCELVEGEMYGQGEVVDSETSHLSKGSSFLMPVSSYMESSSEEQIIHSKPLVKNSSFVSEKVPEELGILHVKNLPEGASSQRSKRPSLHQRRKGVVRSTADISISCARFYKKMARNQHVAVEHETHLLVKDSVCQSNKGKKTSCSKRGIKKEICLESEGHTNPSICLEVRTTESKNVALNESYMMHGTSFNDEDSKVCLRTADEVKLPSLQPSLNEGSSDSDNETLAEIMRKAKKDSTLENLVDEVSNKKQTSDVVLRRDSCIKRRVSAKAMKQSISKIKRDGSRRKVSETLTPSADGIPWNEPSTSQNASFDACRQITSADNEYTTIEENVQANRVRPSCTTTEEGCQHLNQTNCAIFESNGSIPSTSCVYDAAATSANQQTQLEHASHEVASMDVQDDSGIGNCEAVDADSISGIDHSFRDPHSITDSCCSVECKSNDACLGSVDEVNAALPFKEKLDEDLKGHASFGTPAASESCEYASLTTSIRNLASDVVVDDAPTRSNHFESLTNQQQTLESTEERHRSVKRSSTTENIGVSTSVADIVELALSKQQEIENAYAFSRSKAQRSLVPKNVQASGESGYAVTRRSNRAEKSHNNKDDQNKKRLGRRRMVKDLPGPVCSKWGSHVLQEIHEQTLAIYAPSTATFDANEMITAARNGDLKRFRKATEHFLRSEKRTSDQVISTMAKWRDENGGTLIHVVCRYTKCKMTHESDDIIHILAKHAPKLLCERDVMLKLPLHIAVEKGQTCRVSKLLQLGSPICWEDSNNLPPLEIAYSYGNGAMLKLLLHAGATFHNLLYREERLPPQRRGHLYKVFTRFNLIIKGIMRGARKKILRNINEVTVLSPPFIAPLKDGVCPVFEFSYAPSPTHVVDGLQNPILFTYLAVNRTEFGRRGVEWAFRCHGPIYCHAPLLNGRLLEPMTGSVPRGVPIAGMLTDSFVFFCPLKPGQNVLTFRLHDSYAGKRIMFAAQVVMMRRANPTSYTNAVCARPSVGSRSATCIGGDVISNVFQPVDASYDICSFSPATPSI